MAERRGLHRWLAEGLALPSEPVAPWGDPASVRVFRPGRGFRRLRRLRWGWSQAVALATIIIGLNAERWVAPWFPVDVPWSLFVWFEWLALVIFPLQLIVSLLVLELDWRERWYHSTDRSLRLRDGLFTVREMTISLVNIQHVSLKQNLLQRWFGIADLEVRTAGGGGASSEAGSSAGMHLGRLRGIENAEQVRDEIVARWHAVRRAGDSDLGAVASDETASREVVASAARLEAEALALLASSRPT